MPTTDTRSARLKKISTAEMAALTLTPDNYELFELVCDQFNSHPNVTVAQTASGLGVTVDDLCRWVIGFKERRPPAMLPLVNTIRLPRDPELRAELIRLRRREASLVTVATEAPDQLARVQRRILSIERAH